MAKIPFDLKTMKADNSIAIHYFKRISIGTLTQRRTPSENDEEKKFIIFLLLLLFHQPSAIRLNSKMLHISVYNQVYQIVCQQLTLIRN